MQLLEHLPDAHLFLVGRCSPRLAADLRVGADSARLHFEGVDDYVSHERIISYYLRECWTAGLAIFPYSQHSLHKELTKVFEYMAYGIPVLCADFPNLREIVEGAGCGLCVNPEDGAAAAEAVRYLWENPEVARQMGERGREAARTTLCMGHGGGEVAASLFGHPALKSHADRQSLHREVIQVRGETEEVTLAVGSPVSVVIPARNAETTLPETLEAIFSRTTRGRWRSS